MNSTSVTANYWKLLLPCTAAFLLFTGIPASAATSPVLSNCKGYGASQIEFETTLDTGDCDAVTIYRSVDGGSFTKLDQFPIYGTWQSSGSDEWYTVGDRQKMACYRIDDLDRYYLDGSFSFVDSTVTVGHTYSYQLELEPDSYSSAQGQTAVRSNTVSATTSLEAPELIKSFSSDGKSVKLGWNRSTGAQGYQIYRQYGKKWSLCKTVTKGSTTTFTDKKTKSGKTYRYRVRAWYTRNGQKYYSDFGDTRTVSLKKPTVKGSYKKGSVYGPSLSTSKLTQVRRVVQSFKTNYIRNGMSEYEKAFTAFSYLRANCRYARRGWQYNNANTAWGALVYGEAQCSGYARAMKALCDAIGIKCYYVHANSKASNPSHQWTEVRIDGNWYIVDPQSGFFLVSAPYWQKQMGMYWNTKGLPKCSTTNHPRWGFYGSII